MKRQPIWATGTASRSNVREACHDGHVQSGKADLRQPLAGSRYLLPLMVSSMDERKPVSHPECGAMANVCNGPILMKKAALL